MAIIVASSCASSMNSSATRHSSRARLRTGKVYECASLRLSSVYLNPSLPPQCGHGWLVLTGSMASPKLGEVRRTNINIQLKAGVQMLRMAEAPCDHPPCQARQLWNFSSRYLVISRIAMNRWVDGQALILDDQRANNRHHFATAAVR